jgi:hypothetical protein
MPLTQEDKEWFREALNETKKELHDAINDSTADLGKRVARLEHAFSLLSRSARFEVVERAKKEHGLLLRQMFDEAALLLIPPFNSGSRAAVRCSMKQVQDLVKQHDEDYEVELNKSVGYRLVHNSRSAQTRRKAGASLLRALKQEAPDKLGLNVQYDKPWELRGVQTTAHKFLKSLKNDSGGLVTSATVRGGFLLVNDLRLAPEFLGPSTSRWGNLFPIILKKIRGWGSRPPASVDTGLLTDVFGAEFAADRGVVDLDDLPLSDYEYRAAGEDAMHH